MKKRFEINWEKRVWPAVIIFYILIVLIATIQAHLTTHLEDGRNLTSYNNYLIFKQSFTHLIHHQDLYLKYKYEYWDIFKYTPTYAMFMAPFSIMHDIPGLFLWNLLNVALIILGLNRIGFLSAKKKTLILLFSLIEIVTSLQNEQSNGLVTGLIICAFVLFERRQLFWSTGIIVFVAYLKLLGIAVLISCVFYPQLWRSILYSAFWMIFFLVLPLLVISPAELLHQYQRWLEILGADLDGSGGLSVMTVMRSWLFIDVNKMFVQIAGIVLACTPLFFWKRFSKPENRLLFLSAMLVWMVIFNHKAESPSFIIAIFGVAIWYVMGKGGIVNTTLFVLSIVFTQLSSTDLFPESWQTGFFTTYAVKALPCVLIWLKMNFDLYQIIVAERKTVTISH